MKNVALDILKGEIEGAGESPAFDIAGPEVRFREKS